MAAYNSTKDFSLNLITGIVIVCCLSVTHFAFLFKDNFAKIINLWGDNLQITAYLNSDATLKQIENAKIEIKKWNYIKKIEYVSQEKASSDFMDYIGASHADFLLKDSEIKNLVPPSLVITLDFQKDTLDQVIQIEKIAQDLKKIQPVSEVTYGSDFIQKFSEIINSLNGIFLFLILLILTTALFAFSNAIRVRIQQREEEIQILELLGATNWSIRKPHIIRAAMLGLFGAAIALLINFGLFNWIVSGLSQYSSLKRISSQIEFSGPIGSTSILLLGTFLGTLAATICINSINNGWAAIGRKGYRP